MRRLRKRHATTTTPASPSRSARRSARPRRSNRATQFNYQNLDHPLSFAIIDDVTYTWGTELRYLVTAPLLGHANRFTLGLQYAGTNQRDKNFANVQSQRGDVTKDQTNKASNIGVYLEEQFDATDTLTLVLGGRGQYAYRSVSDHFLKNGDQSGNVDFFAVSPKLGGIWRVTPAVQVYGNISHAYEPPLILELTAPGQIGGNLDQLQAQKSWQFEVGTRGTARHTAGLGRGRSTISSCGMRFRTSMSLPFPGRPLPFRATRTSTARGTWGSRWGVPCSCSST